MHLKHFMTLMLLSVFFSIQSQTTRIAILADIHVEAGNTNDGKLREAVSEINATPGIDLVVVNGDLTNEGSDAQLSYVKSILDMFAKPHFVIPGNHEDTWSQSATKTFIDLWGNDRFVTEINDLVVIGANCGPYMKMGDGHVKQEDLHWLKSTLDEKVKPESRVVSFNHYPLIENDMHNCGDYIEILEQFPTIIHINGHYHKFDRYKAGNLEAMMVGALLQGKDQFGYSILEVDPTEMRIYKKTLGQDPVLLETFPVITKHELTENRRGGNFEQPAGFEVEKIWTDSASVFTRLAFDNDNVYFGNSLGYVKSVDKKSGKLKWSVPTGASLFARQNVVDGKVFVPGAVHEMIILDSATGNKISSHGSTGPYVADGTVADGNIYQGGYKKFEKWDAANNRVVWTYDSLNNYCQAAPVVDGDDVIFGAWDTSLRSLNKNTGKLNWVWNNGKKNNLFSPGNCVPVVSKERVYIVAPDRYMTAIDRKTGETLWRDNSHKYRESLGRSSDTTVVYAKTMDGELVAVDITKPDFSELWVVDMGIGYEHAPCIVAEADGIVYAGSRRGIVTAVDPVKKEVIWSLPLGVSEVNGIDIDPLSGDVYVSLVEGTVFHIAKK